MLALLREEESVEDRMIQTDISDEDLEKVLDRTDLIPTSADQKKPDNIFSIPLKGPGWEVVMPTSTAGVLSTLNS